MANSMSPRDLAESLCSELARRKIDPPSDEVVTELFETMYFASLKTEESQPITFHVVFLDPQNPDPRPPRRIVEDRWSYVAFDTPIEVNVQNLVKVAKASDPRSSSFAIYCDSRGKLFLWGLIDQQNSYHKFINHDSDRGPERPGVFQASISGIGHLVAYIKYEKVAELKINAITKRSFDVFSMGPVSRALRAGIDNYMSYIENYVNEEEFPDGIYEEELFTDKWNTTLCRLILRVKGYRHGGTIIITPDTELEGLNVKYNIQYNRLNTALQTFANYYLNKQLALDEIYSIYETGKSQIPVKLYRQKVTAENRLAENTNEIEGALWFVSLLSRVDGAIILNSNLEVRGFGAEIIFEEKPQRVYRSRSNVANINSLSEVDYNHFGTRHRSVMRYCSMVPGSVGVVISQDGDVRVFLSHQDRLIMWENIKLQYHEVVLRAERSKSSPNKRVQRSSR